MNKKALILSYCLAIAVILLETGTAQNVMDIQMFVAFLLPF